MTTVIILAAGKSERMGTGVDKAFLSLGNKPVVAWSLLAFERCSLVDRIILVVRKDQIAASKAVVKMFGISKLQTVVSGGSKRQDSVKAGIDACEPDTRYIVVHDAARPLITPEMISDLIVAVKRTPAVTLGHRITDTIKRVERNTIIAGTEDRGKLWAVQTPQAFQAKVLRAAYKELGKTEITDDCQAVEMIGETVKIVESNKPNFKITVVEDLQLAGTLLK